ncbi:hypothetical protein FJY90_02055 [Candidatus Gottesmanbacteria bacterium]|nr:hypothetical protein [Candidatus Gottesmanbacteria bacterium]
MITVEIFRNNARFLPPKLWSACPGATYVSADNQLHWQAMAENVVFETPPGYPAHLQHIVTVLENIKRIIPASAGDPHYEALKTREMVRKMFPGLRGILGQAGERQLFHGERLEEYINEVALPEAKRFREWLLKEHLPEKPYHQPLQLLNHVDTAGTLLDLVRLYGRELTIPKVDDAARQLILEEEARRTYLSEQQQIVSLLGLTYLYALVDLTRRPEEEALLKEFSTITSKSPFFFGTEKINLLVLLNAEGKCIGSRICRNSEDAIQRAAAEGRPRFINDEYTVRRFGCGLDEFAIFGERGKSHYSEMLKIMRGRDIPVRDRMAVRFILGEKNYSDKFIKLVRNILPGWIIEEEGEVSLTPSTGIEPQMRYYAYKQEDPNTRIELVIHWLNEDQQLLRGSWIPYLYEKTTNHHEFRMRQLLGIDTAGKPVPGRILADIFPDEIYSFNWDSPETQQELLAYAYSKILSKIIESPAGVVYQHKTR